VYRPGYFRFIASCVDQYLRVLETVKLWPGEQLREERGPRHLYTMGSLSDAPDPPRRDQPEDNDGESAPVERQGLSDEQFRDILEERGASDLSAGPPPISPKDAALKLEQLRNLLFREPEFETRYPAAYKVLFTPPYEPPLTPPHERDLLQAMVELYEKAGVPLPERRPERWGSTGRNMHVGIGGLPLPSFGVRVLRNEPRKAIRAKDSGRPADVYSVTSEFREMESPPTDQEFIPVDPGYLRGILLAIMSREEYSERVEPLHRDHGLLQGLGELPDESPIRLTDLRLVSELGFEGLRRVLIPVLKSLEYPLVPDSVVRWKRQTLGDATREVERMTLELSREPTSQEIDRAQRKLDAITTLAAAVSFAAAALLLFIDLDMPGVEDATPYQLGGQIELLAETIQTVSGDLEDATGKLAKIVAYRSRGRPPRLSGRDLYEALYSYRMGEDLKDIAPRLGVTPYAYDHESLRGWGTKNWRPSVLKKLAAGVEWEREQYPQAAEIFAKRDNPNVQSKAMRAYQKYLVEQEGAAALYPWLEVGDEIGVNAVTPQGLEMIRAYVQLGSCIERGIDPLP
jgi:hypothetical protein